MSQRMRWVLVLGWCIVIYCFSEFSVFTGANTERLLRHLLAYWPFGSQGDGGASPLNFLVRKSAHLSAFGILAVLVFQALLPRRWAYIGAWVFAAVYAATDEWHQSFEPGRTAAVTDVAIDACGALIALCIVFSVRRVQRFKRNEYSA
ncbi:VanZ family protein [Anoxybacillus voinovskiensis]|uniref:VanZ family protein n=1 Tax=Anoxybacteroides voinovskiense TaxID=230470 RepID=A0A840DPW6_9BACL|nr:VanZ family protein [Anoxybacillus voinovskiensis]MBB4075050.1 VanZ family protein [Anoxybacillus voinovskiensis]GGJ76465.1 teicoplanin resistance protein VanZ [Anoxybacillus voinovskiensis]